MPEVGNKLGPLGSLSDHELLQRFESQNIRHEEWTHAEHCRVACIYLSKYDWAGAVHRMRRGIIKLNNAQGVPNTDTRGYHETMTIAWLRLIAAAQERANSAANSIEFLTANSNLLARDTLAHHYSKEQLTTPRSRRRFTPPDRAPLP